MVELHPDSSKLTNMAIDVGRFEWIRLSMVPSLHRMFSKENLMLFISELGDSEHSIQFQ